jgi:hypothetical protein
VSTSAHATSPHGKVLQSCVIVRGVDNIAE